MSGILPGAAGDPWLALGLELRLVPSADGGRQTPVLLADDRGTTRVLAGELADGCQLGDNVTDSFYGLDNKSCP
jgi:hypothetical protein